MSSYYFLLHLMYLTLRVLCPLLCQVDYEGDFPIEGGKEAGTLMTRYVSRPLRQWTMEQQEAAALRKRRKQQPALTAACEKEGQECKATAEVAAAEGVAGVVPAEARDWGPTTGRLRIDDSGRELTVEPIRVLS
jgi:hypothetical protein